MIEELGELSLCDASDANVPVNIFIGRPGDDEEYPEKWTLYAANFMPRKGKAAEDAYFLTADSLEELQKEIAKYIVPLYSVAYKLAERLASFKDEGGELPLLYYWKVDA